MKKSAFVLNLIFFLAIIILDIFYIVNGGIVLKSITSACFFLLGVINLIFVLKMKTEKIKFSILLLVGLFFAMLGDILLEINFIVGAIFFAIGHIFYFISFCFLERLKWTDLIFGIVIFIPSVLVITLYPHFDFGGVAMELLCVVYAFVISFMVGKAISMYVAKRSISRLIIMIGTILFFFSDLMLLFNVFSSVSSVFGVLCLATYYPAEFLLAFSILFTTVLDQILQSNNSAKAK